MSDGYKNILANGYMRDTNYIIIKDCDNIDELNTQWNKFLSNMTIRQQRLSDDKSIEIWNITNQQHYEIQKQQFLEKLKKKDIEGNKETIPSNIVDLNDDTPDSIFSSGDFDEFKKDIDLNDPKYYTEDNNINLTLPDDIKDDPNDNAMEFNQDSTMSIVGNIAGNNDEDKLKNLEKEFIRFNSQSNDMKRKADDKCRELYGGVSNLDRYNKLKSEYLSNKTKETPEAKDFIPSIEPQDNSDNDEIKCNEKICRCHHCNDSSAVTEALHNDSFIARCYSAYILNSINEASDHKEMKRLEDVPYFTPQELIDLGVHGNNNYYSKMSDNDGLTKDISISTWFDSYKDLSMNHIFEDYRKEWINKLNELYSDYYDIRDEDKLLARKQSILDLGWNPEIPFTNENRIKASDRVNEIFKQTTPNDIFINMSNIPESDDCLSETVDSSYEPVFLVLTKGKTPIISQGIKFVTNSEYSHASITFDPELEEVYSFNMRKESFGFVRENKSSFKDNFISVFAFFAPKNIVNKLKETVYDFGNHKTTFDLKIFANKIFHINHKASNNEYNQVCSTFVDTVLQSGGINLVGDQKIPAPSDIYNGAKSEPNKIFEVYNGIAPKYDGKKVKRQINYLRTNQDTLSINEACKDLKHAREFVYKVGQLAKKYNANYFIVTDGASGIHNNGNPAVKNARDAQVKWENDNGGDPDEDWSNDFKNESLEEGKYDAPLSLDNIKSQYGDELYNKLKSDPIHSWRATTGIELIHKEPTKKELERIMKNWNNMTEEQKKKSDNESIKLFGITNKENYKKLISSYNESNEISDIYYNDENISERDDYMLEYIQDIKNKVNPFSKKTFYHISFDENLDEKTLTPRVPSWINRMVEKDKDFIKTLDKYNSKDSTTGGGYEEYKTPRVCFSNSIEGCLNAIITMKDRMKLAGKQIHVYIPENPIDQYKTKSNKMIQKDGDIFDANITNEMWILEPVNVKYIGSIVVDKVITEKKTKMSNNKKKTLIKYIYKWHWFHKIKYDVSNESADISDISEGNDLILEAQLPEGVTLSINEGIIKDIKKCKESIKDYRKLKKDYKILTKDLFPDKDNEDESNDSIMNEDVVYSKLKNNGNGQKDPYNKEVREIYSTFSKEERKVTGFTNYRDVHEYLYYRKIYYIDKDVAGFADLYLCNKKGQASNKDDYSTVKISYGLKPKYRKRGLGDKIISDTMLFCKNDKYIETLVWPVELGNDPSNYLAQKYGLKNTMTTKEFNNYEINFNKSTNESFSFVNEVKKFPIEFDDSGNLTIYKCRMGNISYGDEIDDSSELLESYRNTNNIEGMKYEVSRLWFIISDIEKKMTKRIDSKKYDEYVRNRATATNIFKHNLEYLMKMDKDFNFAEYYNTTPFSNNSVKITNNTLKYSMKTLQQFIMK